MDKDLDQKILYEGVKAMVECGASHIHLPQQKLYTLFSLGFQYLLFLSTKDPGHYILRIEDSYLLEKLARNAKDHVTRGFLQKMALPRKLKWQNSTFHLDFFNMGSWSRTSEIPADKLKGALVVKNTNSKPLDSQLPEDIPLEETTSVALEETAYLSLLTHSASKVVFVSFDDELTKTKEDLSLYQRLNFDFIKDKPREKMVKGVKIYQDINLDNVE
jgi:hypothetical protein